MSDTTTNGVRIESESFYDAERSSRTENRYLFSYKIRITNVGEVTVQLISREWFITDDNGDVQRVQGDGVVGEQPVLAHGESFEYTSFCPLNTPGGTMHGTYHMAYQNGAGFDAIIAPFELEVPYAVN